MTNRGWFAACIAGLAAYDVVRSAWLPGGAHLAVNVAAAAALGGVAIASRLTAAELGLAGGAVASGLRWGGAAFAAVALPVAAAAAVHPSWFEVDRAQVSGGELLRDVLVVIPLGTVLLEELAFRGVLTGLAGRLMSSGRSLLAVAALFALWHVPGAWKSAFDDGWGTAGLASAGTVAATFGAGLAFGWLRQRSRSLLAPSLAHLATNTVPYAAAWIISR